MRTGVAIDLGTSGFRAQKIDLDTGEIRRTAVTIRNPLPGANIMDHMDFAMTYGLDKAHGLVINTVRRLLEALGIGPEGPERIAVCGNPIQLSVFQGIPIDDLAYAGKKKKEKYHITDRKRESKIIPASEIAGLEIYPDCQVVIPPAIKHEIGADALALIVNAGLPDTDEIMIATDFGTNAEMALKAGGVIYTGSAAAGPALEGQEISCGALAGPHTISDVVLEGPYIRCYILNSEMKPETGDLVDPVTGISVEKGNLRARGITGTGVISLIEQGIAGGLITLPKINTPDHVIHLQDGITFIEKDVKEAGNAIGALRAGHMTLCAAAGISPGDIKVSHMSGAAGTYMDAAKAYRIGMNPYNVDLITQIGNTSLKTAREILLSEDRLRELQDIASKIVGTHVMFATSDVFKKIYILELSYWGEGMSFKMFWKFLKKKSLPETEEPTKTPVIDRRVERDIPVFGDEGYQMIRRTGTYLAMKVEDPRCAEWIKECPTHAMSWKDNMIRIRSDLCDGSNCRKCRRTIPPDIFSWDRLTVMDFRPEETEASDQEQE